MHTTHYKTEDPNFQRFFFKQQISALVYMISDVLQEEIIQHLYTYGCAITGTKSKQVLTIINYAPFHPRRPFLEIQGRISALEHLGPASPLPTV